MFHHLSHVYSCIPTICCTHLLQQHIRIFTSCTYFAGLCLVDPSGVQDKHGGGLGLHWLDATDPGSWGLKLVRAEVWSWRRWMLLLVKKLQPLQPEMKTSYCQSYFFSGDMFVSTVYGQNHARNMKLPLNSINWYPELSRWFWTGNVLFCH